MKFQVTRTSDYDKDKKPCDRAVLSEHKTCYGESIWEIEINSLEDLIAFRKEVGHPVILLEPYDVKDMHELEIYDYYRE